jgi:Ice-binding-like
MAVRFARIIAREGGARAGCVLSQVGGEATLGRGCAFVGTNLAGTTVKANTGPSVVGRLLVETAAVNLNDNDISVPPNCVIAPPVVAPPVIAAPMTLARVITAPNAVPVVTPPVAVAPAAPATPPHAATASASTAPAKSTPRIVSPTGAPKTGAGRASRLGADPLLLRPRRMFGALDSLQGSA